LSKGKRSTVSLSAVIKGIHILLPYPGICAKLIQLQAAKLLFPLLNPKRREGVAGKIHQLSIRITDLCNLRCRTCGQWGESGFLHGSNPAELKNREVSGDRYIELFDDLVGNGHHPNVYIWGGEPTMYRSLVDVIGGAVSRGLPTSLVSNGHGIAGMAEKLTASNLYLLQLSIDGHNEEIHNKLRPSAGGGDAFGNIVEGLEAVSCCRKRGKGLPIVASLTVISRENINHLVDIFHRFKEHVDIFVFYLSWWIDEEQAAKHEEDFAHRFGFSPRLHRGWIGSWRPDEYETITQQAKELTVLSRSLKAPSVTFIPQITGTEELKRYYTDHSATFGYDECVSIFQAVELDSNGDMSPCRDYHDYIVGNIKEHTITELWNNDRYRTFRASLQQKGLMPVCRRCCGLMGY